MITIDIAMAGVIVGLLATIFAGIAAFLKVFRRYDSLPDRVAKLEKQVSECPVQQLDVDKLQSTLDNLSKRSENDFRMIAQINRSQNIMMDGLCAVLDHLVTGNHTAQMEEVKTEMMKELLRSREEVLKYDDK